MSHEKLHTKFCSWFIQYWFWLNWLIHWISTFLYYNTLYWTIVIIVTMRFFWVNEHLKNGVFTKYCLNTLNFCFNSHWNTTGSMLIDPMNCLNRFVYSIEFSIETNYRSPDVWNRMHHFWSDSGNSSYLYPKKAPDIQRLLHIFCYSDKRTSAMVRQCQTQTPC